MKRYEKIFFVFLDTLCNSFRCGINERLLNPEPSIYKNGTVGKRLHKTNDSPYFFFAEI